jgi:heat shock protein HslJ
MSDGPMTEHEAIRLLDQLGGLVEVGGPRVERVLAAGRRAGARRRRLQVGGVAAAVAAVAIGAGVLAQQTPASAPTPPSATTATRHQTADRTTDEGPTDGSFDDYRGAIPTEAELWGTWRPVWIDGSRVHGVRRSGGSPLLLSFRSWLSGTGWTGYDGCNWTSGRARLSGGTFSTARDVSTLRGCLDAYKVFDPTIPDVVVRSASVTVSHGRLRFYDGSLQLLAVFAPTDVSMY